MRSHVRIGSARLVYTTLALVLLVGGVMLWQTNQPSASADNTDTPSKFIMHEWGTFTNFAGSDGVQLDFRPIETDELPTFVFNRATQFYNSADYQGKFFYTRQRMETPVTYFYTDRPREIDVRVDFPDGLLTEFFPPVKAMGPKFAYNETKSLKNSFLDWGRVRILPEADLAKLTMKNLHGQPVPAALPAVIGDNHYAYARETDSAVVEFTDRRKLKHYEKFLFYRGVGDFNLPLQFAALGNGRFEITNFGDDAIQSLFLVTIENGRVRFAYQPLLAPHAPMFIEQSPRDTTVAELSESMVRALIATGLYEKEARSMVKTWHSSWFGEDGTRLLYLVPERLTNVVLPLKISPAPDETLRVLVGRMEILTPEHATRIASTIRELGSCFSSVMEPLAGELQKLGRFAEPAIASMTTTPAHADVREQLEMLLAEIRVAK